jgi:hypothetical protein
MRTIGLVTFLFLFSGCTKQVLKASVPEATVALKETGEYETFFCGMIETQASTDYAYWTAYLQKAFERDSSLLTLPAGRHSVVVNFVIDRNGAVKDATVRGYPGFGLAEKAIALIKAYDGAWTPATRNGRNCNSYRSQPITFVIEED